MIPPWLQCLLPDANLLRLEHYVIDKRLLNPGMGPVPPLLDDNQAYLQPLC